MLKKLKQIYLLLIAFGLLLIVTDNFTDTIVLPHSHLKIQKECTDISNHFTHSHSHGFEKDIFTHSSTFENEKNDNFIDLHSTLEVYFSTNYGTCIWQPPRFF